MGNVRGLHMGPRYFSQIQPRWAPNFARWAGSWEKCGQNVEKIWAECGKTHLAKSGTHLGKISGPHLGPIWAPSGLYLGKISGPHLEPADISHMGPRYFSQIQPRYSPYGAHMGPRYSPYGTHMGPIWDPYGAQILPRSCASWEIPKKGGISYLKTPLCQTLSKALEMSKATAERNPYRESLRRLFFVR